MSKDSSVARFIPDRSAASAATRSPSGEDERIPLHDFASGYAPLLTIAQYQRTRTGEVAQSGERALGLAFLDKSDADNYQDKAEKHGGFTPVAEQEKIAPQAMSSRNIGSHARQPQ